ncbi:nuclear transport factor 2 family protein [Nocardia sp. NPDC127526]|uniref:nuclear transport factor 2 family protein n=1 Tax=Nocardia sp. NPDC127526 TaxID=3345393 RepID=UPI00362C4755
MRDAEPRRAPCGRAPPAPAPREWAPTPDATVNAFFAAFGARDLDALLALIAEHATWTIPGDPAIVPWAGQRDRNALADGFFRPLFEAASYRIFEDSLILARVYTGDPSLGLAA